MKGTFELVGVDKVEAVLTITMPVGDWKVLDKHMENKWPDSELKRLIQKMVYKAEEKFYGEQELNWND